jgi:hypothetical protein
MPPPNTPLNHLLTSAGVVNVDLDGDFEDPKYAKIAMFKKIETLIVVWFPHHNNLDREIAHVENQLAVAKQRTSGFEVPKVVFKKMVR